MIIFEGLKYIIIKFSTLLLAILVFTGSPIILLCSTPIFFLRYIIKLLAPWLKPDLANMVTTRGTGFAVDDLYNKPKCNIVLKSIINGVFNQEDQFRNLIQLNLLEAREADGRLKYPELKQYLKPWAGFYFWKECKNFNLDNHVRFCRKTDTESILDANKNDEPFSTQEIENIFEELSYKTWKKEQPYWEFIVFQNCDLLDVPGGPHTVIMFRVHHAVTDGYSMFSMMTKGIFERVEVQNSLPKGPKRKLFQTLCYVLSFPFRSAYETAEAFIVSLLPNFVYPLPFEVRNETKTSGKFIVESTSILSVQKIKEIKNNYNVSFSSVVHAILAGGLMDLMKAKNIKNVKIFPNVVAWPIPGHPEKLRNYMSAAVAKLPTSDDIDPLTRLRLCNSDYERIKRSTFPVLNIFAVMTLGSYFASISKFLVKNRFSSAFLTNFPGGLDPYFLLGHKQLDISFVTGLLTGRTGIAFCALTYNMNTLRIVQIADPSVVSREELKYLTDRMEAHLDILYDLSLSEP